MTGGFIAFGIGVCIGCVMTFIIERNYKTGYGAFKIEQMDDPDYKDFYKICISVIKSPKLLDKNKIILLKDNSPK